MRSSVVTSPSLRHVQDVVPSHALSSGSAHRDSPGALAGAEHAGERVVASRHVNVEQLPGPRRGSAATVSQQGYRQPHCPTHEDTVPAEHPRW